MNHAKKMQLALVGGLSILASGCDQTCTAPPFPTGLPVNDGYHDMEICQIQVHMADDLYASTATAQEVYDAIAADLLEIEQRIPTERARFLRSTQIWAELDAGTASALVYHPSEQWLVDNGMPAKLAKDIQIQRAQAYLDISHSTTAPVVRQPAALLHEFAHALFDQRDDALRSNVQAAYDNAITQQIYDNVALGNGSNGTAYAATNVQEYFAELSEAYFWDNDGFPFDRNDLEMRDPMGLAAIEAAWGIAP